MAQTMRKEPLPFRILLGLGALSLLASGCSTPMQDCMGASCGDSSMDMRPRPGDVDPSCKEPKGTPKQTVVDHFTMPTTQQPCAVDLDGDGKTDNALMLVVGGLKAAAFDLQQSADLVVESGELIQLISLTTEDLSNSRCAQVSLRRGLRTDKPPLYDGTDEFKVNPMLPTTQLLATLSNRMLETPRTLDQKDANVARVELSLPAGFGIEVPLPVAGVHLSGLVNGQGYIRGELHGVVREQDVNSRIIPAIAQVLTTTVRKAPGTPQAAQVIATFETKAKCDAMPDLCCQKNPMTCQITADEVRQNRQTQTILKPDVQMWNGDRFAPNPLAEKPDSLSVGLCFTAVSAKF